MAITRERPSPRIDGWELLRAIRSGDKHSIGVLLASVSDALENAEYFLVEGVDLSTRFLGAQILASNLRSQGDLITCAEVASALFRALEHDPGFVHGSQAERHMVNNVLDLLVYSLSNCARYRQLIVEYPRWLAVAERTAIDPYFGTQLRLRLIEAQIHAGDYERAVAMIDDTRPRASDPQQFELRRLERKVQEFYGRVDEVSPEAPSPSLVQHDALASAIAALAGINQPEELAREMEATMTGAAKGETVGALSRSRGEGLETLLGAPARDAGLTAVENLARLTSNLPMQRSPLFSLIDCMNLARDVLLSTDGQDAMALRSLHSSLEDLIDYTTILDLWDDRARAKWMKCVTLKRLGNQSDALAAHRDVRLDIESRRTLVEDPLMRARFGAYFNYLYKSNAELLYTSRHSEEELFHVIENAKGKILAESSGARPFIAARFASHESVSSLEARALDDLRQILPAASAKARYVSYLADDDCTYAIVVDADGKLSTNRIAVGAATLSKAALELRQLNDGDARTFRPKFDPLRPGDTPYTPVTRALSPLIDWLDLDDVELLCISPPPEISAVPMHMCEWRGEPLIDQVGLVQTPSAEILSAAARESALTGMLSSASVFAIPRAGSRGNEEARSFERVTTAIRSNIPDTRTAGALQIDKHLLQHSDLTHQIVHFSCHGYFDHIAPLKRSGLFIANEGELPNTAQQERFILNAEDAAMLQISGSHITLSACVCGRSFQITPGEALGMIWGFLRGNARSVLAACWNADREASADLLARFYELWLSNVPKWQALRQAMREIKSDAARSHPYFWAPFALHGYWN